MNMCRRTGVGASAVARGVHGHNLRVGTRRESSRAQQRGKGAEERFRVWTMTIVVARLCSAHSNTSGTQVSQHVRAPVPLTETSRLVWPEGSCNGSGNTRSMLAVAVPRLTATI